MARRVGSGDPCAPATMTEGFFGAREMFLKKSTVGGNQICSAKSFRMLLQNCNACSYFFIELVEQGSIV